VFVAQSVAVGISAMPRVAKPKPEEMLQPFDVIIVEWEDAYQNPQSQYSSPEEIVAAYTPCIRRTVGYFMGRNKNVTIVATDDDRTSDNPRAIGGPVFIPAHLVRSTVRITNVHVKGLPKK